MSTALRPVLRTTNISTLSSTSSTTSKPSATFVCQSCRNAHLLRRPKRPYTFTQLVALSDGSAFTMRTTSPHPIYRSTRDTRNAPLWNPSSKELTNVEDDEAGRLASFRARYGRSFDARKTEDSGESEPAPTADTLDQISSDQLQEAVEGQQTEDAPQSAKAKQAQAPRIESDDVDDGWDFGDDDASMLDLISSYGQEDIRQQDAPKGKKGKK